MWDGEMYSGQAPEESCCEQGNEPQGCTRSEEFFTS